MDNKYQGLIKKTSAKFLSAAITLDTLLANSSIAYSNEIPENSLEYELLTLEHSLLLKTSTYLSTGLILLTLSHFLKKDNPTTGLISRFLGVGSTLAGLIYGLAYLYK